MRWYTTWHDMTYVCTVIPLWRLTCSPYSTIPFHQPSSPAALLHPITACSSDIHIPTVTGNISLLYFPTPPFRIDPSEFVEPATNWHGMGAALSQNLGGTVTPFMPNGTPVHTYRYMFVPETPLEHSALGSLHSSAPAASFIPFQTTGGSGRWPGIEIWTAADGIFCV